MIHLIHNSVLLSQNDTIKLKTHFPNVEKFLCRCSLFKSMIEMSGNWKNVVTTPLWEGVRDTIWWSGDQEFLRISEPPITRLVDFKMVSDGVCWRPWHAISMCHSAELCRICSFTTLTLFLSSLESRPAIKQRRRRVRRSLQGFWTLKFPHNYILIAPLEKYIGPSLWLDLWWRL